MSQAKTLAELQEKVKSEFEPEQEVSTEAAAGGEELTEEEKQAKEAEVQEYVPNFKFSVQGVEYEFDEPLRAIVTDPEKEKYVKDIMERAKGLDAVKEHRDRLITESKEYKTKLQEIQSKAERFENHLSRADTLYQKGDILAAMKHLGFNDQDILKAGYILADDDPVKKQAYEAESRARITEIEKEHEVRNYQEQIRQANVALITQTAQSAVNMPGIKEVADIVDAKAGKQGSFLQELYDLGNTYEKSGQVLNRDFTIPQLAEAIANKYRPFISVAPVTPSVLTPIETQDVTQKIVEPTKKQTIPSPRSGGSPARKKPASMADLLKRAEELGKAV
jgi:hypothetical protein